MINFIYELKYIICSTLISFGLSKVLNYFSIFEDDIAEMTKTETLKNNNEDQESVKDIKSNGSSTSKSKKTNKIRNKNEVDDRINKYMNSIKWKFKIFFPLMMVLLLFFWYYLSSFCAVFSNSQEALIIDSLYGYAISFIYPSIIILIPCIIRFGALKNENMECLYSSSGKIGDFLLLLH